MADDAERSPAQSGAIEHMSEEDLELRILRFRKLTGILAVLYSILTAFLTLSHLYTWGLDPQPYIRFLPLHLGILFLVVFFLHPTTRKWSERVPGETPWRKYANYGVGLLDLVLALIAVYTTLYLYVYSDEIIARAGRLNPWDITVGTVGILLLAEATRRAVGLPMVVLSGLFVAYAMYGSRLRDTFLHPLRTRDRSWNTVVDQLWFGNEGVFDIPIQVAATYVIIFVTLGAFFKYSGVGEFFINIAYALTGHRRGGPAKTSILASALMGTVSGSSIGNAVTTGAFTIPIMRKVGYTREFAGGVEASASSGGQIMPPILGAAAFVMIEFLAIPYRTIIIASILPALAFFVGSWIMVHLEAKKRGLRSVPKNELPDWKAILRTGWFYLIPFILLFALLFSQYMTIFRAGIFTILVTYGFLVVTVLTGGNTGRYWRGDADAVSGGPFRALAGDVKEIYRRTREAFDEVGRNMAGVTMACAAAGVIGGIVKLTGFGAKIVILISQASGGIFFIALVLTMIACLVLGMGLPTTATYIVVVTVAAPAIVNFPGLVPPNGLTVEAWLLAAHMFVLFYGVVADVTPPVSLAAFAASGIAGGDQFKTGLEAFKISANKFLVPFAFIYQPAILFIGVQWTDPAFMVNMIWDIALMFIGIFFLHAGLSRFMIVKAPFWEGMMLFLGGVLMMLPFLNTDIVGILLVAVASFTHVRRARAQEGGAGGASAEAL